MKLYTKPFPAQNLLKDREKKKKKRQEGQRRKGI